MTRCRLHPVLLELVRRVKPYGFRMTSGCRSYSEQASLYRAYLAGNNPFPVAAPGRSAHQRGLAVDMDRPGHDPYSDPALLLLGRFWREAGGTWGESDPIHFEIRPH